MKILFIEWKSFGNEDIKEAFDKLGHDVVSFIFDNNGELYQDERIEKSIKRACVDCNIDIVFSLNYYPIIAKACYEQDICYISWIYDSPFVMIYSHTIIYPTNHIFIFDKSEYFKFKSNGITNVHYMPLASNVERLEKMLNDKKRYNEFSTSKWMNKGDVAFVGSLYTEKHQFYQRLHDISDRTRGYLEGIMEVQKHIYGCNIIQELLTNDIMDDMSKNLPLKTSPSGVESREYLFAEYVINRQLTAIERAEYLDAIAEKFSRKAYNVLDLYTPNEKYEKKGIVNHGPVDYYDGAPYVYNNAKININISLRSIHTGIPLRIFDIIGAGGFCLTNFQMDLVDCFEEGSDYVGFTSKEDMLKKIEYYLYHDKERIEIAKHGWETIKNNHTYEHRINEMLAYII